METKIRAKFWPFFLISYLSGSFLGVLYNSSNFYPFVRSFVLFSLSKLVSTFPPKPLYRLGWGNVPSDLNPKYLAPSFSVTLEDGQTGIIYMSITWYFIQMASITYKDSNFALFSVIKNWANNYIITTLHMCRGKATNLYSIKKYSVS